MKQNYDDEQYAVRQCDMIDFFSPLQSSVSRLEWNYSSTDTVLCVYFITETGHVHQIKLSLFEYEIDHFEWL